MILQGYAGWSGPPVFIDDIQVDHFLIMIISEVSYIHTCQCWKIYVPYLTCVGMDMPVQIV